MLVGIDHECAADPERARWALLGIYRTDQQNQNGQEDAADLRTPLRASEGNDLLDAAIAEAISRKPKGHDFVIDRRHQRPALSRHMSVTGG